MKCKKRIINNAILSVLIFISLASCIDISPEDLEQTEYSKIQKYLDDNPSLNFDRKASGLFYLEVKTGTGLPATSHDTAFIFYSAKLLDNTLLESNVGTDDTLIFLVAEDYLLAGLDEGMTFMREGGKAYYSFPPN